MQALIVVVAVFILSFILTWCLRCYALKNNVIDIPNQRSSHCIPTPRGGGVAIVISIMVGLITLSFLHLISFSTMLSLLIAGGITAVVGFLDDHGHIAARWRLLMHFLAAATGLFFLGYFPAVELLGYTFSAGWIGMVFGAVYLVWMLNLYNFMDGINGLASMEAIVFSLASLLVVWIAVPDALVTDASLSVLLLGAATLGFIFWNFPHAKIFMGDAGSGFLGITIGLLALYIGLLDSKLFLAEMCLLGVFIVDATWTLLRRLLAGKKIYEAHASHGYQILARKYASHNSVTLGALGLNLVWLTPFAMLIASGAIPGVVGLAIAWAPVLIIAWRCGAGVKDKG